MRAYEEYKESGYEWLGKIPAHWNWHYLFQACSEQLIKNKNREDLPVLSLSYGKIIIKENINFGLTPKDYADYQIVNPGNIILRLTDLQNDHKSLRTGLVENKGIITIFSNTLPKNVLYKNFNFFSPYCFTTINSLFSLSKIFFIIPPNTKLSFQLLIH